MKWKAVNSRDGRPWCCNAQDACNGHAEPLRFTIWLGFEGYAFGPNFGYWWNRR